MQINTMIIEDEPPALERLKRMLEPYNRKINIIGSASSGNEAVMKINETRPDLVFMDVQIPELNGFEILERIDYSPYVIFSTGHDEFALKAFKENSIDYLMKPVSPERLEQAVNKIDKFLNGSAGCAENDNSGSVLVKNKLLVKIGTKIKLIDFNDICFFEADNKYILVNTYDKSYPILNTICRLESDLPNSVFVKIHRSALININYIDEIRKSYNGVYKVVMENKQKTVLNISRKYKSNLGLG